MLHDVQAMPMLVRHHLLLETQREIDQAKPQKLLAVRIHCGVAAGVIDRDGAIIHRQIDGVQNRGLCVADVSSNALHHFSLLLHSGHHLEEALL